MQTNMTVNLGSIEETAKRRAAYQKAADKASMKLGTWARAQLDKSSGYNSKEIKNG